MLLTATKSHTVNTAAQPFQPDEYIPGYASKLLRRSEYFFALGVADNGFSLVLSWPGQAGQGLGVL